MTTLSYARVCVYVFAAVVLADVGIVLLLHDTSISASVWLAEKTHWTLQGALMLAFCLNGYFLREAPWWEQLINGLSGGHLALHF